MNAPRFAMMDDPVACRSEQQYPNCYIFPRLGSGIELGVVRLGGTGLANLLFTWARAVVFAHRYGMKRIAPTWPQICRGPWIRGDSDKRTYHNLFLPAKNEIAGPRRLALLAAATRVSEANLGGPIRDGSVIEVQGVNGYLRPALPYADLVRQELLQIVRPQHQSALREQFSPEIAIHVRLGDFGTTDPTAGNNRLHLGWYEDILKELRRNLGPLPAVVFSDGTDDELAPLLRLGNARRVTFGSSIADILGLSRSRILVASGSTFSLWASFIGQMPTIWFPGRLIHPVLQHTCGELETERQLSPDFLDACSQSLALGSNV